MKKRYIALATLIALILPALATSVAETRIEAGQVALQSIPTAQTEVSIPIRVTDGGLAGIKLIVTYDEALTYKGYTRAGLTNENANPESFIQENTGYATKKVCIVLASAENWTDGSGETGELINLHFTVPANAPVKLYRVGLSVEGEGDAIAVEGGVEGNIVIAVELTDGGISVGFMLGDVNGDGAIDNKDVILILRDVEGIIKLSSQGILAGDLDGKGGIDRNDAVVLINKIVQTIGAS